MNYKYRMIETIDQFLRMRGIKANKETDGRIVYWSYLISEHAYCWLSVDDNFEISADVSLGKISSNDLSNTLIKLLNHNSRLPEGLRFFIICDDLVSLGFKLDIRNLQTDRLLKHLSSLHIAIKVVSFDYAYLIAPLGKRQKCSN